MRPMADHVPSIEPLPPGTRLPTIRCYKCGKLVDHVMVDHHVYMMEIVIRVSCHGEVDEMRMTAKESEEIGRDVLLNREGIAFQPKGDVALSAPVARISHG